MEDEDTISKKLFMEVLIMGCKLGQLGISPASLQDVKNELDIIA